MAAEFRSELEENLSRYLRDEISLQAFEDWFAPVLWEVADSHDEEDRILVGTISNRIAEYSYGDISEDSLRRELANAVLPFEGSWRNFATNSTEAPSMPVPGNSATNVLIPYPDAA